MGEPEISALEWVQLDFASPAVTAKLEAATRLFHEGKHERSAVLLEEASWGLWYAAQWQRALAMEDGKRSDARLD